MTRSILVNAIGGVATQGDAVSFPDAYCNVELWQKLPDGATKQLQEEKTSTINNRVKFDWDELFVFPLDEDDIPEGAVHYVKVTLMDHDNLSPDDELLTTDNVIVPEKKQRVEVFLAGKASLTRARLTFEVGYNSHPNVTLWQEATASTFSSVFSVNNSPVSDWEFVLQVVKKIPSLIGDALFGGKEEERVGGQWEVKEDGKTIMNWAEQQEQSDVEVVHVGSTSEVVKAVRDAEKKKLKVRALGSGHSFSKVGLPDQGTRVIFLNDNGGDIMKVAFAGHPSLCLLPQTNTKAEDDAGRQIVGVGAGVPVSQLNEDLEKEGLSLDNLGSAGFQTFAGAMCTGTHGTGVHFGPVASMVVAVEVVGGDGKFWRVEPEPVTDKNAWNKYAKTVVGDTGAEYECLVDKTLFQSLLIAFGSSGVIVRCLTKVRKMFYLTERRHLSTPLNSDKLHGFLKDTRTSLLAQTVIPLEKVRVLSTPAEFPSDDLTSARHYDITLAPYAYAPELEEERTFHFVETARFQVTKKYYEDHADDKEHMNRNIVTAFLGNLPIVSDIGALLLEDTTNTAALTVRAVQGIADKFYTDKSYLVQQLGYGGESLKAFSSEWALPVDRPANLPQLEDDLIALLKWLQQSSVVNTNRLGAIKEKFDSKSTLTSPVGIRFVRATDQLLGMQRGMNGCGEKLWCLVEFPCVLNKDTGGKDKVELLHDIEKWFFSLNDGVPRRPHWGQHQFLKEDDIVLNKTRELYGKDELKMWGRGQKIVDPKGTFENEFSKFLVLKKDDGWCCIQ